MEDVMERSRLQADRWRWAVVARVRRAAANGRRDACALLAQLSVASVAALLLWTGSRRLLEWGGPAAGLLVAVVWLPALAGSLSCKESWTWSSPAASSRSSRASLRPRPEVIRLLYSPADAQASTSTGRSGRANGSPPDRCTCRTPSAPASANTRCQLAVGSSCSRRSSSTGLEQ